MKRIRAYSKSEDAYVAASILGSQGIEAVVVDDNAFGGNLFGVQKSAIRLEVEEDSYDQADEILKEAESHMRIEEPQDSIDEGTERKLSRLFNLLVFTEVGFLLCFAIWPGVFYPDPGEEINRYLETFLLSKKLWILGYQCYPGFLVLSCLASLMLLLRLHIGRVLFIGVALYSAGSSLVLPAAVSSPIGGAVEGFSWMLTGVVLVMSWLPPIGQEFRKRLKS